MTASLSSDSRAIDPGRYRQILWFFSGVIAHLVWWDLLVGRVFKARVRRTRPDRLRRMSRRFRDLAVNMGGVMIKLGQFLSARVDVLPPEITEELAGLQDEVPPVLPADIQTVLAAELGDLPAHFATFDTEPVAAASLGQAHQARLWPEQGGGGEAGPTVVVKVQRPDIEQIVRTDLAALRVIARWAMRYRPIRRRANVPALLEEFAATLWEELDYELEAGNAERFGRMFSRVPQIRIPAVYREHSTRRVLVLEDVGGIKITDLEGLKAAGVDRSQAATRLLDAYFRQIFREGFFHADPHPGNLFIIPEELSEEAEDRFPRPFQLAFVDFGMVGQVEELMGQNLRRVLVSITQRDARSLIDAYNDLGFFLPGSDLERIAEAQARVLDQIWGRNLLELSRPDPREMQELGREFRDLLFEFPFQVPQDFIYLGRTLGILSGLASLLDPQINPWHLVERYGREIIRGRGRPEVGLEALLAWLRPFFALPAQMQRVLAAAEEGRLRVQTTPDRSLLRRVEGLEKRLARLNLSILLAAALVSGTILYVNGEIVPATAAAGAAALFLLLMVLFRD